MEEIYVMQPESEMVRMYAKMYHTLFNAITDALEAMKRDETARHILIAAQKETEELYMNWTEDPETRDP